MLNYYYKNGIHHFSDEDDNFIANGGWDGEEYSLHVQKSSEYRFKTGGNYITIVDNDVRHYYDGELHGTDTLTLTTVYDYENCNPEKEIMGYKYNLIPTEVIEVKKLLDEGKIW